MTVSTTNNRISYAGNGVTTAFSFPNKFFADSDLVVTVVVDATGIATTKTLTTHYTVSGAGDDAGGTVTMLTAPATGETLVIYRDPPLTQLVDLVNNDDFDVDTGVERPLDRLVLICQRLKDLSTRALRLNDADTTGAGTALPVPVANRLLGWNAAATAIENKVATDLDLATVTAFIATLMDDTDAATARTTLGAVGIANTETITGDKTLSGATVLSGTTKRSGASTDQGAVNYTAAAGTDTYTSTHSPALTALNTGAEFAVYFANANTVTTPTWNPDGLGAKTIKRTDGSALLAGDINGQHRLRYDGTDMILLNPVHVLRAEELGAATVTTPARNDDSTKAASTAWVRDHVGEPSNNYTIFKCGGVNIPQNATRYLKAVGTTATATEADAQVPIGLPTEFYEMKIYLSEAVPNGQTVTVTVRKDAADTSLTQVITGPTSAGAVVSATGSVLYGKKYDGTLNQLSVKVVCSATTGSTNDIVVSLLARVPGSNYKPVSPFALGSTAPGAGVVSCGGEFKTVQRVGGALDSTTLGFAAFPVPQTVFEKFDQSENTAWPYINENASNQVTGNYNLPLPLESAVSFAEETANIAFTGYLVFSDRQCGNETGTWSPLLFGSIDQAQNTTRYMGGYGGASANATEATVQIPVPAGKCWKLRARSNDILPAGQTAVITVRKNGVDTALTVTLTDAIQTESDESNSFTTADNDLLSISCVTSATAGTRSYNVVLELDRAA